MKCITRYDMKFGDIIIPARTECTIINNKNYSPNCPGVFMDVIINNWDIDKKEIDAKNDKWCIMNDVENKDDSWLEIRYNTITRHYSWFDKKVFCQEDYNDNEPTDIQYIFHITNSSIEVLGEYSIDMK